MSYPYEIWIGYKLYKKDKYRSDQLAIHAAKKVVTKDNEVVILTWTEEEPGSRIYGRREVARWENGKRKK